MPNLAKYLVWLNWLASLATNAPVFIAAAFEFYEKIKAFFPKLPAGPETPADGGLQITQALTGPQAMTHGSKSLVADVLDAEEKVLSLCACPPEGGTMTLSVREGSRLREIFAFLTMLRELLAGFGIGG